LAIVTQLALTDKILEFLQNKGGFGVGMKKLLLSIAIILMTSSRVLAFDLSVLGAVSSSEL
jgi:hypothetical protein